MANRFDFGTPPVPGYGGAPRTYTTDAQRQVGAGGNSGAWRPIDDPGRNYYDQHDPQAAFRQFTGDLFGQDTYQGAWATQQFADAMAEYLRMGERDPFLKFTDTLTGDFAGQLNQRFQNLSANQRGERPAARGPRILW